MKRCRDCKHKLTKYCDPDYNYNPDKTACEKFEVKKDCRNCKYLDYSNRSTCHCPDGGDNDNAGTGYVCKDWRNDNL